MPRLPLFSLLACAALVFSACDANAPSADASLETTSGATANASSCAAPTSITTQNISNGNGFDIYVIVSGLSSHGAQIQEAPYQTTNWSVNGFTTSSQHNTGYDAWTTGGPSYKVSFRARNKCWDGSYSNFSNVATSVAKPQLY